MPDGQGMSRAGERQKPIVLFSELYAPAVGGSAVLYANTYGRLRGIDVTVVTDRVTSPGDDSQDRRLRIVRRSIATPSWGILDPTGWRRHWAAAAAVAAVRPAADAIVHCGRALPEAVSLLVGWPRIRRPFVVWEHGEGATIAARSRELRALHRGVLRAARRVIVNARNTARLVEDEGVPPERISLVYPGVDPSAFRPDVECEAIRRRCAPNGEVLLVTVGRLQRRKGHDLVVQALASMRAESSRLRWVIVGDGEERARLERTVAQQRLGDRIVFAGIVSADQLPAYYAACDIFVHPNRVDDGDIEGFGIVFLEAAASERAVIGGASGGVPEAVVDGETGLLVSGTEVTELAAAIRTLVDAPERRRRMGVAGRRRVIDGFTWERSADALARAHALASGDRVARG